MLQYNRVLELWMGKENDGSMRPCAFHLIPPTAKGVAKPLWRASLMVLFLERSIG